MNLALVVRLALAPGLVGVATLAARRWGVAAGGWAASTPVVAGPVLLVIASDHGQAFGAQAAGSATLGLISLALFTTTYARTAGARLAWYICLPLGWAVFVATALLLSVIAVPPLVALVAAIIFFRLCRLALGPTGRTDAASRRLPGDIPLRMLAALAMVVTLSLVAGLLGARLSGLLAPFPIIGSVMAAFTHVTRGRGALEQYTDALLNGLPSFALFTAMVALTLRPLGVLDSFVAASALAAASHLLLIQRARPRPGVRPKIEA
ncbi:MAG: hypothetical protein M3010_01300 [Candidatus Dormibacteraeota bacterium]|nr:hypothetical protein [Candidatus Dormibacteraeota bacterium]